MRQSLFFFWFQTSKQIPVTFISRDKAKFVIMKVSSAHCVLAVWLVELFAFTSVVQQVKIDIRRKCRMWKTGSCKRLSWLIRYRGSNFALFSLILCTLQTIILKCRVIPKRKSSNFCETKFVPRINYMFRVQRFVGTESNVTMYLEHTSNQWRVSCLV